MKRTTTHKKITPKLREIKRADGRGRRFPAAIDWLGSARGAGSGMNEALGAQKGERTEERMGYSG
jgi:hypothetical protein